MAYGVQLTRMGNFDVNLSPEDEQQLKQLAKDTSYSQLAGGFGNYAQGEMALGAGQGMAQGGARFCMGCGQPLTPAVAHCTECGAELPAGAHFCAGCGTRVAG